MTGILTRGRTGDGGDKPVAVIDVGSNSVRLVVFDSAKRVPIPVFNEKVVGLGLAKNQQSVVELYVGDNGSWTILVTLTNGMSCIAAAGENWADTAEQVELAS